jgi:hypothetical protein
MTRRYGWGPRSERVREAVPAGHWCTLTVLAALTTEGVLASMSIESPTDGDVFLAFVEQVLAPRLQLGHLVILSQSAVADEWKDPRLLLRFSHPRHENGCPRSRI